MIREIAVSETRVIYGAKKKKRKKLRMDFILKLHITKLKALARLEIQKEKKIL